MDRNQCVESAAKIHTHTHIHSHIHTHTHKNRIHWVKGQHSLLNRNRENRGLVDD
jgi:hypothetical protein